MLHNLFLFYSSYITPLGQQGPDMVTFMHLVILKESLLHPDMLPTNSI